MNNEVSLGKRQVMPTPQVEHENLFQPYKSRKGGKKIIKDKRPSLEEQFQKIPQEIDIAEQREVDKVVEFEPHIHNKIKTLIDILLEVCFTNKLNLKKYRSLEVRPRSLLNKVLNTRLERHFLDIIDICKKDRIDTTAFLKKPQPQEFKSLALYFRFRRLLEERQSALQQKTSKHKKVNPVDQKKFLPLDFFTEFLSLRLTKQREIKDDQGEDDEQGDELVNIIIKEIETLKQSAADSLHENKSREWLWNMSEFLKLLIAVPPESVVEQYRDKVELKLMNLFHDQNRNLSKFYVVLKSKIKQNLLTLPFTLSQIEEWDRVTVAEINQFMIKLKKAHYKKINAAITQTEVKASLN